MITIESVWSPRGFRACIFFEIALLCDYQKRRKGEDVWAISVSAANNQNDNSNRFQSEYYQFSIAKGHWPKSLKDLLLALDKIRQTGLNETISQDGA